MSDTVTAPSGLDTLSSEESALLSSMRDDGGPDIEMTLELEAAEVEIEEAAEPVEQDRKTRTVPQQALHEEREKRKAAEARVQAAELKAATELARVQERLALLASAVQTAQPVATPAPEAVEIPDVNVDPVGHFKALFEQTNKKVSEQDAILRGFKENQERAAAVGELRNWGASQEVEFQNREPTYNAAMDFLKAKRHEQLAALGITDAARREAQINQDVTQIAVQSRQENVNFAERLYGLATAMGFAKPAAADPELPAIPPLGADVTPALQRAQRGRDASVTIGSTGSAPAQTLSAERLANMSDADFAAQYAKIAKNPTALRALLGG